MLFSGFGLKNKYDVEVNEFDITQSSVSLIRDYIFICFFCRYLSILSFTLNNASWGMLYQSHWLN